MDENNALAPSLRGLLSDSEAGGVSQPKKYTPSALRAPPSKREAKRCLRKVIAT